MKTLEGTRHEGCYRGFVWGGGSWNSSVIFPLGDVQDDITIGLYHEDGGTTGEFSIEFDTLNNSAVPHLSAYDDSWDVLVNHYSDLLRWLSEHDGKNISPEDVVQALKDLGVQDNTQYKKPERYQ